MSRKQRLGAYVETLGDLVWGESDCCTFAAKWAAVESGKHISFPAYASKDEAHAMIAQAGGLEQLVSPLLTMFPRTEWPQLGDIGVLRLTIGDVGAIFADAGIACLRAEKGVYFMRPKTIVAAWTV